MGKNWQIQIFDELKENEEKLTCQAREDWRGSKAKRECWNNSFIEIKRITFSGLTFAWGGLVLHWGGLKVATLARRGRPRSPLAGERHRLLRGSGSGCTPSAGKGGGGLEAVAERVVVLISRTRLSSREKDLMVLVEGLVVLKGDSTEKLPAVLEGRSIKY